MRALSGVEVAIALSFCIACAGAPPAGTDTAAPADSSLVLWGDEYDEPIEPEEILHAPRALHAEWSGGASQSSRLDATAEGVSVRVRSSPRGDTGSLAWRGAGLLREIAVGHVAPAAAEGALVGPAGTGADLRASPSLETEGLRMTTATSPSSSTRGVGVVLEARSLRASAGGCDAAGFGRFAFAGLEHREGRTAVGVVTAMSMRGAASRGAGSVYASRERDAMFASGEVALSDRRVRTVARIVAGERREWSAVAVAGAGPARAEPLAFSPRERWGAAVERRDAWAWGSNRIGVSSLTRRDDTLDVRRRRVAWEGSCRVADGVQLELAARLTREQSERRSGGWLAGLPDVGVSDDWRVRATVRAARSTDGGLWVENAYRLEWVQNRSGRPGTLATWTGRVRSGPLEGRISATAHALLAGQVAYEAEAAPPLAGQFAAISGRGAAVTASARAWLRRQGWLGVTWTRKPPAEERIWVSLGVQIQRP